VVITYLDMTPRDGTLYLLLMKLDGLVIIAVSIFDFVYLSMTHLRGSSSVTLMIKKFFSVVLRMLLTLYFLTMVLSNS
jgi:hypothetical protein